MNKQKTIGERYIPVVLAAFAFLLLGAKSYAVTATDSQCDSRLDITVAASARSSVPSAVTCQTRSLTTTAGFTLAASSPSGVTVADSAAMVSAGGELYESFVAGSRQANVLLTPNRAMMMSRNITSTTGVDWDMGLTVQPVSGGNNAYLTGTYAFLRANRETRVVDAAHQTNAGLSGIFDPVSMRVTFNGDATCSVAAYSSWFGYELTTDPALFYNQPDGNNYGLHQAVYAGTGSGQQHKDSNLSFSTCTYSLATDGKLVVNYVGTKGDATAFNVNNTYFVSADTRYIVSTVDATKDLYRGFEVGMRVTTRAGDQTTLNNSLAGTYLFNSPSVELQGATGPLTSPNNQHLNDTKATQCMNRGAAVLSTTVSGVAGWNVCTIDMAKSCATRSEVGYGETSAGAANGDVSIIHTTAVSASAGLSCRFQLASDSTLSMVVTMQTAEGLQDVTFSGAIDSGNQVMALRGKYEGTNMTNPSGTYAPARTIKNDLYLSELVGVQYSGTLSADADADGRSNKLEFLGSGLASSDIDGDATVDTSDAFPLDASESIDTDSDGTGNNADTDDDNDLMPDTWETTYGFNPLVNDASGDVDTDGHTNVREYTRGTNPTVPNVKNDFGGDAKADVLLRNTTTGDWNLAQLNGLTILNQGTVGAFSDIENVIISTADFDGDGDADILTRGTDNGLLPGTFRVELTAGTTVTDAAWLFSMSADTSDVVMSTKDFNKDGKADVLLRNSATGVWTVNYMSGTSEPTINTLNASTDLCYTLQGDGDYDGNGYPDILLRRDVCGGATYPWLVNSTDGDATILASGTATGVSMNTAWGALVTDQDFNGDGKDDILMRALTGSVQQWTIYNMNGVGAPSASGLLNIAVQSMWQFAADADFNADGKDDIVLRSVDTGQWYGYLLDNTAILSGAVINMAMNPIWSLQAIDDYNRDAKGDILLRNSASGRWQLHLMNGLTVQSSGSLSITTDLSYTLQND